MTFPSIAYYIKFGYNERATKFEKIFHLRFDVTEYTQSVLIKNGPIRSTSEILGFFKKLEFKPCGLVSILRDVKAF